MHGSSRKKRATDSPLVESLLQPGAFPHATDGIELMETHISWVILAGEFVYKIKKPVRLDFLDFGELERRKFYCDEEVRLNKAWAPGLYLDVVPITVEEGGARVGGNGVPVEYAVRMHRFDQERLLNCELERGTLSMDDMDELGAHVAEVHLAAQVVDEKQRERVLSLTRQFIWDNFTALEGKVDEAELGDIRNWTKRELKKVDEKIAQRFDAGFFRNCHGDLHLGNLVRLPGGITAFDCIEFDEDLRHIDVFCDIAFLLIDLVSRRHYDLAAHFLNRYLERTGDYDGMSVFSLYFVYRCLVRAKVAAIRSEGRSDDSKRSADLDELAHYLGMAKRQIAPRTAVLVVMSGLSGSGKTWFSTKLMGALPAIRIRSDLERKRMFGLGETENSNSGVGEGIYTTAASRELYGTLFALAHSILEADHNVILDAAFLRRAERAGAIEIARRCASFPAILAVTAPPATLRQRIRARAREGGDASEANLGVLDYQLGIAEPVADAEPALLIEVNNSDDTDASSIAAAIKDAAGRQKRRR